MREKQDYLGRFQGHDRTSRGKKGKGRTKGKRDSTKNRSDHHLHVPL